MTTRVRLTYEDYAALPDDGRRYELHEGELSVTPAPGLSHQAILRNLVVILHRHVSSRGLGEVFPAPVDCILENITIVQPDLVFVETARRSLMTERGIEGSPTLAVEIISPSTGGIDRRRKLQLTRGTPCPFTGSSILPRERLRSISSREECMKVQAHCRDLRRSRSFRSRT
jgi:Uma2 family endonuclease